MKIAVFCSASPDLTNEMKTDAEMLGRWIGTNGHTLVYGGVAMGLMEIVAAAVKNAGGNVVGIVPERRISSSSKLPDTIIKVRDLHERKREMENLADAFIALSGGLGTLDEIISTWSSMSFEGHDKPIAIVNRGNLYSPLIEQLKTMVTSRMLRENVATKPVIADSIGEAINAITQ